MSPSASQLSVFTNFDPDSPPELLTGPDVVTEGTRGSWATFSVNRCYRYLLARVWDDHTPMLVVGMLNPSKAGAYDDDPTIRRVLGFARRDQYGGVLVWNACALIATDPRELVRGDDPVGPRNYEAIRAALGASILARSVLAWGRPPNKRIRRLLERAWIEAAWRCPSWSFGEPTKQGYPRHPLYLRADTPIVEYRR